MDIFDIPDTEPVELTYGQRCALLWAIENALLIDDPESVPQDFDREHIGILLRQARHEIRRANAR